MRNSMEKVADLLLSLEQKGGYSRELLRDLTLIVETGNLGTQGAGHSDQLDCGSLSVGADNVLYCEVDRGSRGVMLARFLRPAYYHLAHAIRDDGDGPLLSCRGRDWPLGAR